MRVSKRKWKSDKFRPVILDSSGELRKRYHNVKNQSGVSISENLIGDMTQIVLPVAAGDTITADVVTMVKFYPNR